MCLCRVLYNFSIPFSVGKDKLPRTRILIMLSQPVPDVMGKTIHVNNLAIETYKLI